MRKPAGKFVLCDARGVAVYKTLHVRFTKKGETMERIVSPRQFIRAYGAKENVDWLVLHDGLCCVVEKAKIFYNTASVMIYCGFELVEHVGQAIAYLNGPAGAQSDRPAQRNAKSGAFG